MKTESPSAIERAREYGLDISLLESNLVQTPTQRLQTLIGMAQLADEALKVQKNMRGKWLVSDTISRYTANTRKRES